MYLFFKYLWYIFDVFFKYMKKYFSIFTVILGLVLISGCSTSIKKPAATEPVKTGLTESEAKEIAEATCIKGGESLGSSMYNEGTKTWWFDANLNSTQEGCNPACVVSEETKTAEINWRCTGLILPDGSSAATMLQEIFVKQYPKYADTLTVRIDQETENHVRGGVIFEEGAPGGIFLALKSGEEWQVVFDGNGEISCDLLELGFPTEMLTDCAEK